MWIEDDGRMDYSKSCMAVSIVSSSSEQIAAEFRVGLTRTILTFDPDLDFGAPIAIKPSSSLKSPPMCGRKWTVIKTTLHQKINLPCGKNSSGRGRLNCTCNNSSAKAKLLTIAALLLFETVDKQR